MRNTSMKTPHGHGPSTCTIRGPGGAGIGYRGGLARGGGSIKWLPPRGHPRRAKCNT